MNGGGACNPSFSRNFRWHSRFLHWPWLAPVTPSKSRGLTARMKARRPAKLLRARIPLKRELPRVGAFTFRVYYAVRHWSTPSTPEYPEDAAVFCAAAVPCMLQAACCMVHKGFGSTSASAQCK